MESFSDYVRLNSLLAGGELILLRDCFPETACLQPKMDLKLRYPQIGIYAGTGTSHSWLWFAEIFERLGFLSLSFPDETSIKNGGLSGVDVLAVSGGDTFAIARALGPDGAKQLESFLAQGGLYIGSCAGAYLPMHSSKDPLHLFNFSKVKITNLSRNLPRPITMPSKFYICYGCDYIFHPVREEIRIKTSGRAPFCSTGYVLAPMYGGPGMITVSDDQILAIYDSFTPKTLYLVDKKLAERTMLGRAAAVKTRFGRGHLYLFGPHLEHPSYPEANKLIADSIYWETAGYRSPSVTENVEKPDKENQAASSLMQLKRELSNSRLVAAGLELVPQQWLIGNKVYEPEKIRVYLEFLWNRCAVMAKRKSLLPSDPGLENCLSLAGKTTYYLRQLKQSLDAAQETTALAKSIFELLHELARRFLTEYFRSLAREQKKSPKSKVLVH